MDRIKRVMNIYLAPSEAFKELKEKSDCLFPFIVVLLISLLSTYILMPSVIIPAQVKEISSNPQLSLEQKNAVIDSLQGVYPYVTGFIGALIGLIISYLFLSAFIAVLRFIFGGDKISFKNVFSGVAYIGCINILATIFASVVMYSTGKLNISLSLGLLFPNLQGYLGRLMNGINIFGIWQTILLSILLMVFYNYSKVKSFSIMFSSYLVWILIISSFKIF